ncbi:MAG: transketolase [Lachnospiraceae bacterium]|nr:transketolase [Lachnospiraceae bacterium]
MLKKDEMSINAIRVLSADAIQKAKSGHPGLPLGSAAAAYELWARHLNHNPKDPKWANRDRFVLSGGHGSMLLYSLLHLYGYEGVTLEEIKQFRQYGSLTPGHPEYGHTAGVEASTGPLGAGMGMAVGMAMAEAHLAAVFNKPGYPVVDHYTFALGGDGCMMEGISSEAFSLAGSLGLGKLIILYDSNGITIEGSTDLAFTENVQERMRAFGFQTLEVEDGNDIEAIGLAIEAAKADLSRPSFITIHTQIGYGCPKKMGTASAHGEPLGDENILEMKQFLNWPSTEPFFVPEEVYDNYRALGEAHAKTEAEWQKLFDAYCAEFPEMKEKWDFWHDRKNVGKAIDNEEFWKGAEGDAATRNLSGATLNRAKDMLPQLFGGSADLAPSNKSRMNDTPDFSKDNYAGRNMHFGIREIAMAAIENGLALHGGLIPYCATFFVFSDYTKPMVRLASIMGLPTIYIFSHDSIGVGEDGPTHEPVEQTAMLRALPNFRLFRPADANETNAAWFAALTSEHTPTAIASTRQNLPQIEGTSREALKGGYVVQDSAKEVPDVILIASGSELQLAVGAKAELAKDGIDARVVSMPCMDLFEEQDEAYKEAVLPKKVRARVAVEALTTFGWDRYVGLDGKVIGMHGFGQSGPYKFLFPHYGFTVEKVVEAAKEVL